MQRRGISSFVYEPLKLSRLQESAASLSSSPWSNRGHIEGSPDLEGVKNLSRRLPSLFLFIALFLCLRSSLAYRLLFQSFVACTVSSFSLFLSLSLSLSLSHLLFFSLPLEGVLFVLEWILLSSFFIFIALSLSRDLPIADSFSCSSILDPTISTCVYRCPSLAFIILLCHFSYFCFFFFFFFLQRFALV